MTLSGARFKNRNLITFIEKSESKLTAFFLLLSAKLLAGWRQNEKGRVGMKSKGGGGHCGFLWSPLLVNKLGRVKLDKRKRPYEQCDHLQQRKEGVSSERQLPLDAEPCGSKEKSERWRENRGSLI